MIDVEKRNSKHEQKEKVRRRMRVEIDPENYEYIFRPHSCTVDAVLYRHHLQQYEF